MHSASALWMALALLCSVGKSQEPSAEPVFFEAAKSSGIDFEHRSPRSSERHLPETMGSGVAWLDFDGDGHQDLYIGNSGRFPSEGSQAEAAANALYRNLGEGRFEDWTVAAGAGDRSYTQGVTAADLDGDGAVDLYLATFGKDRILWNQGNGGFKTEVLEPTDGWSSSAAAADFDLDGDLDLYVARYLRYQADHGLFCGDTETGVRRYCDPSLFLGEKDLFLRNDDSGTFQSVAEEVGLAGADGRGLGVLFTDLDADGLPDLYVANDLTLNLLYRNMGTGAFEDVSLLSGAAVNGEGKPEAGMGVAWGDVDGDGDGDLFVTNFDVETNTYYENAGSLFFLDQSSASGLGPGSFNQLGFGVVFEDFDLDGDVDAFVGNGHIFEAPARENVLYRQPDQLFWNDGEGRFLESAQGFPKTVSRGVAVGDLDSDGDGDLAVVANDGVFALYRNERRASSAGSWLGVELVGKGRNGAAVGAQVELISGFDQLAAEPVTFAQLRWVTAGDSYQSTSSTRMRFGLPEGRHAKELRVVWPSGRVSLIREPSSGRYLRVFEP